MGLIGCLVDRKSSSIELTLGRLDLNSRFVPSLWRLVLSFLREALSLLVKAFHLGVPAKLCVEPW